MELSQMEHEVNEAWAMLSNDILLERLKLIMSNNPPFADGIKLSCASDAALIKMCISYIGMKLLYEKIVAQRLQSDHDEPPYTKNE